MVQQIRKLFVTNPPVFYPAGQVLDLIYEDLGGRSRVRKFSGICVSSSRKGVRRCTLRNVFNGLAIELSFPTTSKLVLSLVRSVRYKSFNLNRSKLFYLREKRLADSRVT